MEPSDRSKLLPMAGTTQLSAGWSGAQIPEGTRDSITKRKAKPKCKVPVKGGVLSPARPPERECQPLWGSLGVPVELTKQEVLKESTDSR